MFAKRISFVAIPAAVVLGLVGFAPSASAAPNAEVTLNFADLISRGQTMQKELREKLRLDLEDMSRQKQLERKESENNSLESTLTNIPLMVYVG